jgi:hypothetical protein
MSCLLNPGTVYRTFLEKRGSQILGFSVGNLFKNEDKILEFGTLDPIQTLYK